MNTVTINGGGYSAALLPDMGANLISLRFKNYNILHTPESAEILKNDPYSYGIPILCPPNKISGARFNYKGREFSYPVNMPDGACLHGVLHNCPWQVESKTDSSVRLKVTANENKAIEKGFGLKCEFYIEYSLNENGLTQTFTVKNGESYSLPFGLSYHTAFNIPFSEGSKKEDLRLKVPVSTRCKLNEKLYPALENEPLSSFEEGMQNEGVAPLEKQIDMLYNRDMKKENLLTLTDISEGVSVCYKADEKYLYWVIWNDNANRGFIGLEPQTFISNAPVYLEEGKGNYGVLEVKPGQSLSLTNRIFVKEELGL